MAGVGSSIPGELLQNRRYVSLTSSEILVLSTFSGNPLFASASSSSQNKVFARLSARSREPYFPVRMVISNSFSGRPV